MMKLSGHSAIGFVLVSLFTVTVLAQAQTPSKVAMVNTDAFYQETGGIKKIADAYKKLDEEFKKDFADLERIRTTFDTLEAQVEGLEKVTAPVDPEK